MANAPPPPPPPPPAPTRIFPATNSGVGQEITFIQSGGGIGNPVTFGTPTAPAQTLTFSNLVQIQSGARLVEVNPNSNPTDSIGFGTVNGVLFDKADGSVPTSRQITVKNQSGGAWDYGSTFNGQEWQTFGYWAVDSAEVGNRSGAFGSFSVGTATTGSSIPAAGASIFRGDLLGYVRNGLVSNRVGSSMSLAVDFSNRTADFTSADWADDEGVFAGTALHGTLTYGAGQNALSGQLTTANGILSGPAVAQFYGPSAEEVGGAFSLTETNGGQQRVVGAFGAKR